MPIQCASFFVFRAVRTRICPVFFIAYLSVATLDAAAPPIGFSSYFGGSEAETINDMVIDAAGNVYVVGTTGGAGDFPQMNAHQTTDPEDPDYRAFDVGQSNCFVASFAPNGTIRFSTYLGGSLSEEGLAIALDESANVYVAGATQSFRFGNSAFPTTEGAFKTDFNAFECAFVASYSSTGTLRYSTVYDTFGGTDSKAVSIHANANGSATVLLRLGGQWRLVTFSPDGSSVLETIELGVGGYTDMARGKDGSYHIVGNNLATASTSNSFSLGMSGQPSHAGYQLRSETGEVIHAAHWAANLAGEVAVDDDGRAVVVGGVKPTTLTSSHISTAYPYYGFPLKNALQPTYGGGDSDAYVIVIDPSETGDASLVASSFLGGPENDVARSVATDVLGRIFVAGNTVSEEFPVVDGFPAFDPPPELENGFLAQLNASGTGVIFSSLVGGSQADRATSVAVELFGDFIAVGGRTESDDFHEVNALQDAKGPADAFLVFSDTAIVLESLIVNSANDVDDGSCDSAHCSLREAIKAANQRADRPTISFDIPGEGTPIIQPSSVFPTISAPVVIDGTTQAGGWVVVDGAAHPLGLDGILVSGTDEVELRGLVVQNFDGDGIKVTGGEGHVLAGLRVGTTLDGKSAAKNAGVGIRLTGVSDSVLGGPEVVDALLVSGNMEDGIVIEGGSGNTIDNVIVGLSADGYLNVRNEGAGIRLKDTSSNVIGGVSLGEKYNVVSGNKSDGIVIEGTSSSANAVYRSLIGLAADGVTVRGNGDTLVGSGVLVKEAEGSLIGDAGQGNVISGQSIGVSLTTFSSATLVRGNRIGTDIYGEGFEQRSQMDGVRIEDSSNNVIGGETDAPGSGVGNVISGHSLTGVSVTGSSAGSNRISGNIIGLNAAGNARLPNRRGVRVDAPDLTVGGELLGMRNIISGNDGHGIHCVSPIATGLKIEGNWIGLGPSVAADFNNGGLGIYVEFANDGLKIGGEVAMPGQAPGNVISGNVAGGILIAPSSIARGPMLIAGNIVGLSADGSQKAGDQTFGIRTVNTNGPYIAIRGNVVSGNLGAGIWIGQTEAGLSRRELVLEGNLIGMGLGGVVVGNGDAGVKVDNTAGVHLLTGRDNIITGNGGGGLLANENAFDGGSVALFRQSIYDNEGPELGVSLFGPKIIGIWQQPIFPGVPVPEGSMLIACRVSGLFPGSTVEIFHSEACEPSGVGQGQTWLAASRKRASQPVVTAFLSEVPASGFLSARELVYVGELRLSSYGDLQSTAFSQCVPTRSFLLDLDGDGAPDLFEEGWDVNADEIEDSLQELVASFRSPNMDGPIGVSIQSGGQALKAIGYSELLGQEPPPVQGALPSGYLHIGVGPSGPQVNSERVNPSAEGETELVVYLPAGQRVDSVWAHQPGAAEGQRWVDITDRVTFADGQVTFALADGDALDLDADVGEASITIALLRHVEGIEVTHMQVDDSGRLSLEALGRIGGRYALHGSEDLGTWTLLQESDAALGTMFFDLSYQEISPYFFARIEEVVE